MEESLIPFSRWAARLAALSTALVGLGFAIPLVPAIAVNDELVCALEARRKIDGDRTVLSVTG